MSTTTEAQLFTSEEQITATIGEYEARLAVVRERYDAYHPDMHSRRYVADSCHDAARCVRQAKCWLAGDNDRTYAGPHPSFGVTLEDFRVHYADNALQSALHYLAWGEHYAGLATQDAARAADPWK